MHSLIEGAGGDARNALAFAVISDIAYLPPAEAVPAYKKQFGMDAKLLSVDNTQVYVLQDDKNVVLAFRGTEAPTSLDGIKDWLLTDAVNLLVVPSGRLGTDLAAAGVGARFHQGFVGAIAEIWEPVNGEVEQAMAKSERNLWITGHSLGGALALFSGWLLHRKFISVHQIYTYGAPMVGNALASTAFDREFPGQVFRYRNGPDPVPMLPTISLLSNDYGHCQKEVGLGAAAVTPVEFFKSLIGRAVTGKLDRSLADEIWAHLKGRLDAHAVSNYLTLVKQKFGLN